MTSEPMVPAPVTFVGNTNVRALPSGQILNKISCPVVALVVVRVELVTFPDHADGVPHPEAGKLKTWIVEVATVKVGVAL